MFRILLVLGTVMSLALAWSCLQPACACLARWQTYSVAARSDLRQLVTAQDAVRDDSGHYSAHLAPSRFRPSTGVSVSIIEATDSGWRAVATHERLRGECRIYVGKVAARPMTLGDTVVSEGESACWGIWPREPSTRLTWYARVGLRARPRPLPQDSVVGPY